MAWLEQEIAVMSEGETCEMFARYDEVAFEGNLFGVDGEGRGGAEAGGGGGCGAGSGCDGGGVDSNGGNCSESDGGMGDLPPLAPTLSLSAFSLDWMASPVARLLGAPPERCPSAALDLFFLENFEPVGHGPGSASGSEVA